MNGVTERERHEKGTTLEGDVEDVSADAVTVLSGAAQTVPAQTVKQGAVGKIRADSADVRESAVAKVTTASVQSKERGFGLVKAEAVTVSDSGVFRAYANKAHLERSNVVFLEAKKVDSDARVLLDWRAAGAFGVTAGSCWGFLRIFVGRDE